MSNAAVHVPRATPANAPSAARALQSLPRVGVRQSTTRPALVKPAMLRHPPQRVASKDMEAATSTVLLDLQDSLKVGRHWLLIVFCLMYIETY